MKRGLDLAEFEVKTERRDKVARTEYEYAFKMLAPDSLVSGVLGNKGMYIQELQSETSTKISVSNKDERFPQTDCRLILIKGHQQEDIISALESVMEKTKEIVQASKHEDVKDLVSQNGEFKLRIVLPKAAAGALIGPKGANIAKLRETTNSKVRVEDARVGNGPTQEQIVSLLGSTESVVSCANNCVNLVNDSSSESWFQDWAIVKCNIGKGGGKGGSGKGNTQAEIPHAHQTQQRPPVHHQRQTTTSQNTEQPLGKPMRSGPQGQGRGRHSTINPMLTEVLDNMPENLMSERTFAVQASLPVKAMSAMIGRGGAHIKEIQGITASKVSIRDESPNAVVTVEGNMQSVLGGYCMVMKKYLEIEPTLQ